MTVKQRIMAYLQNHPEGADDDELAKILDLSSRQQANIRCRQLEKEGIIVRRQVHGKIHNYWTGKTTQVALPPKVIKQNQDKPLPKFEYWFWEGNIQSKVIDFLISEEYCLLSAADTASHQQGVDIIAEKGGKTLWVSVKGYPKGTEKTNPSVQAAHWFKHVIFDMIEYRERDKDVLLAVALPDFPRYRSLSQKIYGLSLLPILRIYG